MGYNPDWDVNCAECHHPLPAHDDVARGYKNETGACLGDVLGFHDGEPPPCFCTGFVDPREKNV